MIWRPLKHCYLIAILAQSIGIAEACPSYVGTDLWAESESRIVGIDITYSDCLNSYSNFRYGLSYYANDEFLYQGVTGAFRLSYGGMVSPYVSAGLLAGTAERSVVAEEDGLDNDGDNFIDEPGEEETFRDSNFFLYPEIGVAIYSKKIGLSLSARRYYGSELTGNFIYSFGASIPMK